jgi:hypothetical protein
VRSTPAGLAPFPHCFRLESREGSAPDPPRGERRAGTGPRRDGLGARHDQLTNAAAGVKQVASPFNSSVCPVLSSTYWPRSGRAALPIGVARSRQRTSESQSIESSQRPCARPPTCSQDHIRTENLLINVIGRKDLRSVTKISQGGLIQSARSPDCYSAPFGRGFSLRFDNRASARHRGGLRCCPKNFCCLDRLSKALSFLDGTTS